MKQLSVVLATFNEEHNLSECLRSVKDIAGEIIIIDGSSTDRTVEIAKKYHAKVVITTNPPLFHINKQKAIDLASGEWILQLDADERVSKALAAEIEEVIKMSIEQIERYEQALPHRKLFIRHQQLLEKRDGHIGSTATDYKAFFIPRLNFFLGRYLKYGGVYPDGVIRLIKKGSAYFPCKDVHEQIAVKGRVGWLENPLYHMDSPTFMRYLERNSRYIDLLAKEIQDKNDSTSLQGGIQYLFLLPVSWFFSTYIRHKGFKDSWQGFVFSFFSSLRFPRAYFRYLNHV